MSLHASLKTSGNLSQHRNVLTRTERIERLKETKGYDPKGKPVLGLQKTANRKGKVG
jgi:small basic protein (TIGR04137 family)